VSRLVAAVLFDLDGTLVDSAPDLAGACNDMRAARGMEALRYPVLRAMVGSGARGMIGTGFGISPTEPAYDLLRDEFLERYEARMTRDTMVFPEAARLLERLQQEGRPWGIVTNKAARFAEPLVRFLGLADVAATLVCGDTTGHSKPHPAPLLEAARRMATRPETCVYVGDDHRDVQAGRAAGMWTVAAAWGYLGNADPVDAWGADAICATPSDVLAWIDSTRSFPT